MHGGQRGELRTRNFGKIRIERFWIPYAELISLRRDYLILERSCKQEGKISFRRDYLIPPEGSCEQENR